MKKLLVLFLVLVLLLATLTACVSNSTPTPTPTPTPGDDDKTPTEIPLPTANYTGKTYTVLNRDDTRYTEEWTPNETLTGDPVNDAIAARNQAVERRYGVTLDFESARVSTASFEEDFYAPIMRNIADDYYQLAAGYTYRLATVSTRGYFLNWLNPEQVPVVDMSKEWWDGDFTAAASYNNCSYIATGPLSLTDMYSSACIYFNKTLLEKDYGETGTEDLFDLVDSGEWTLAKLMEYAKTCTHTVEGDETGALTVYGLASNLNTPVDGFIYASNLYMTERNDKGVIQLKKIDKNNKILDLASELMNFFNTTGNVKVNENGDADDVMVGEFMREKAVFTTGILESAKKIQSNDTLEYGVLPYPKLAATQERYQTYKVDFKTGFCIPRSVKENNREFVGTITEALAYYSNYYVKPAVNDKVLKHKSVQDRRSSAMVDVILDGGVYEFANIYAFAWGDMESPAHLLRQCIKGNLNFSNAYSQKERTYKSQLNVLLNNFVTEDAAQ